MSLNGRFSTLNVVTLQLLFSRNTQSVPESFFDMMKEFWSLKSLLLRSSHQHNIGHTVLEGCRPISHVLDLLENFPKLEHLEFSMKGTHLKLPSDFCLTHLTAPIDTFAAPHNRFEMFDNVTHLRIKTARLKSKVLPNFRNLTTLALEPAGENDERLLEHFVANNPKLVNLYLNSLTVSDSLLKRALVNIQCLHVCNMTSCSLKRILPNAPDLRELSLTSTSGRSLLRKMLSLDWLVDAVETGTVISPKLAMIQASLEGGHDDFPSWSQVPVEDLRKSFKRQFPQEALKEMILPVFPIDWSFFRMFVIDLRAMAKWARLGKAGN